MAAVAVHVERERVLIMVKRRSRTQQGRVAAASFNVLAETRTINRDLGASREYSDEPKVLVSLGQLPI